MIDISAGRWIPRGPVDVQRVYYFAVISLKFFKTWLFLWLFFVFSLLFLRLYVFDVINYIC